MSEVNNFVPVQFAELLGVDEKGLLKSVQEATKGNFGGVNVTGAKIEDVLNVCGQTGWTLKVDKFEGSPPGGFWFLMKPLRQNVK